MLLILNLSTEILILTKSIIYLQFLNYYFNFPIIILISQLLFYLEY